MNNIERDKFLTEAMGECWHQWSTKSSFRGFCDKCQTQIVDKTQNDFSTWEGFGTLFLWVKDQKWYGTFVFDCLKSGYHPYPTSKMDIPDCFIQPDKFADAVYVFLTKNQTNKESLNEDSRSRLL